MFSIGNSPDVLSQRIVAGIILVGGLTVRLLPAIVGVALVVRSSRVGATVAALALGYHRRHCYCVAELIARKLALSPTEINFRSLPGPRHLHFGCVFL